MQPVTGTLQEPGIARCAETRRGTLGSVGLGRFCRGDLSVRAVGRLGVFRGLVGGFRFLVVFFLILLVIGRFFVGGVRGRGVVIYVAAARGTGYVAYATAYLDCVGGQYGAGRALGVVGQCHYGLGVAEAFLQRHGAKVNPCSAAHLLVDAEFLGAARVVDRIVCVGRGIGQCLIADVNGIFAILGDVGVPCRGRGVASGYGRHLAVGAVLEWILGVAEVGQVVDEAFPLACGPLLCAVVLAVGGLGIYLAVGVGVIVHYHLMAVGVAFAWQEHVCSGVLKHRHHIRKYVAHGVCVLHGLEQQRALPLPAPVLVVTAVAVPQGHDVIVHTFGGGRYGIDLGDERGILAVFRRQLVHLGYVV